MTENENNIRIETEDTVYCFELGDFGLSQAEKENLTFASLLWDWWSPWELV